jgi:ABC-type phosphate transport system permease subunit
MSRLLGSLVVAWAWLSLAVVGGGVMLAAGCLAASAPALPVAELGPALAASAWLGLAGVAVALPLAAACAVTADQRLLPPVGLALLRGALDLLDGTPGLLLGLAAALALGPVGEWAAVGALALVALSALERGLSRAFSDVRDADRLAAVALGATPLQVLFHVVQPTAWRAGVAAVLRACGRLCGAAAPLLLVGPLGTEPLVLAVVRHAGRGSVATAAALAGVLVLVVAGLYVAAAFVDRPQRWRA